MSDVNPVSDDGKPLPSDAASSSPSSADTPNAIALVRRLARAQPLPDTLLAILQGPLAEAVATAAGYAGRAISERTRAAYQADWAEFAGWCRGHGADAAELPVNPVLVAAWLASLAEKIGRSALRRRVAAIVHHHQRRGHVWSAQHPAIRETLGGIRRAHPKPVRPAAALTSAEIKQLIATCADNLPGVRDRALLLLGFAGAFRRSELVAIDVHHLRFDANGVTIRIPRSKTDQDGNGADVSLPRMRGAGTRPVADTGASSGPSPVGDTHGVRGTSQVWDTCPVRALETWLRRGKIRRGAVFRRVTAHGTPEGRLSGDGVRHILLRRAALAKLTVHPSERLSPHGLRAGLITEAYLAGAPDEQVAQHTRHGDLSSMRGYRRRARITADSPARLLDL